MVGKVRCSHIQCPAQKDLHVLHDSPPQGLFSSGTESGKWVRGDLLDTSMEDLLAYQLDTGDECSPLDSSSKGKICIEKADSESCGYCRYSRCFQSRNTCLSPPVAMVASAS